MSPDTWERPSWRIFFRTTWALVPTFAAKARLVKTIFLARSSVVCEVFGIKNWRDTSTRPREHRTIYFLFFLKNRHTITSALVFITTQNRHVGTRMHVKRFWRAKTMDFVCSCNGNVDQSKMNRTFVLTKKIAFLFHAYVFHWFVLRIWGYLPSLVKNNQILL